MHVFDNYFNEANAYVNELAYELGHENDQKSTIRLLRAVLHTIRDRITFGESLHLLAQLPMVLKALYVEQWTYHENPPLFYDDIAGFTEAVKNEQAKFGEQKFGRKESAEDQVKVVIASLRKFITDGEAIHVLDQMPKEVRELF